MTSCRVVLRCITVTWVICLAPILIHAQERSTLQEVTEAERVLVDISVTGPPEAIEALDVTDLKVKVGLKKLESFTLDRLCPPQEESTEPTVFTPSSGYYLFYFEQSMLSVRGRHRALITAKNLIPKLVEDGNSIAIYSSSRSLESFSDWSQDTDQLLADLYRLEKDMTHFDTYTENEPRRIATVIEIIERGLSIDSAMAQARTYQKEETFRTQRFMQRMRSLLPRFGNLDPPKNIILFADTFRANAGEHYSLFFGTQGRSRGSLVTKMRADAGSLPAAFDSLVNELIFNGIRMYTIESSPNLVDFDGKSASPRGESFAGTATPSPTKRLNDARNTLDSLARETGGRSFLGDPSSETIINRMREDNACLFLLSFDPKDFRRGTEHSIKITSDDNRLTLRHRGRFVIPTEKQRQRARLLNAFVQPENSSASSSPLVSSLIPISFNNGRYEALLQIRVPGIAAVQGRWRLGATLIREDNIIAEPNQRIEAPLVGVASIYETKVNFKPGTITILTVAEEQNSRLLLSHSREVLWPSLDRGGIAPIRILQPDTAIFKRENEQIRTGGARVYPPSEPIQAQQSVAIVGLACHGRGRDTTLEREIIGTTSVPFQPIVLDARKKACVQFQDLVKPNSLGSGEFKFTVRLKEGIEVVAERSISFMVQSGTNQEDNP